MTAKARRPAARKGIHSKCLATTTRDGHTLVCWRSPEHVDSRDAERRKHFDPSAEETWTD